MGCMCTTREKPLEEEAPEPKSLSLHRSPLSKSASFPHLHTLTKPLASYYRPLPSHFTFHNMTLVEYQDSQLSCFLRTYPKPGPMVVEKARVKIAHDAQNLSGLDHPHIARWLEVMEDSRNFYIVTEALWGGEVFQFLANRVSIPENLASRLLSQVLLALCYTHSLLIPHTSLQPHHLLFKSSPSDVNLHIKITGFEDARSFCRVRESSTSISPYIAPEVYAGRAEELSDI